RFVGELIAEVAEGFLNQLRELDDAGHGRASRTNRATTNRVRQSPLKTRNPQLCKSPVISGTNPFDPAADVCVTSFHDCTTIGSFAASTYLSVSFLALLASPTCREIESNHKA